MGIIQPGFYLKGQAMSAAWEGKILSLRGLTQVSFLLAWTDANSPVGNIQVWGTNDPRAANDRDRGLTMATGEAQWIQYKLPTDSVDVDGTSATWTAGDRNIAITGVGAGKASINLVDLPAFMKLVFTYSGGGTNDTINVTREAN